MAYAPSVFCFLCSTLFIHTTPTLDAYWRGIILFGRNVATYKFALAKSLLELSENEDTFVPLEKLAEPFSQHVAEHIANVAKQCTSSSSRFLDACRAFNRGDSTKEELTEQTVRLGFNNVIDAFHVVNLSEISERFYTDERSSGGIRLTDNLFNLKSMFQSQNLPNEVEARWLPLFGVAVPC